MQYKIGNGYDVHAFAREIKPDACITLAGVHIPSERELIAHSDGDVLIHALCDALLGALALGDIGKHFPDTDPQYKGISSVLLLEKVSELIMQKGWSLANADITVLAQEPKLAPFREAMCEHLAKVLQVNVDQVSVKATTTEGLGYVGRKEGIAVYVVVLIEKPFD